MKPRLFTWNNAKTRKGEGAGYVTLVLHLAPGTLSGRNVCGSATAGCLAGCLNTAGRGGIVKAGETTNAIQTARIRRTQALYADRFAFDMALAKDIEMGRDYAKRQGMGFAVRLNGTSDLSGLPSRVSCWYPEVTFYDYTKHPQPWKRETRNYTLTFSRSESNDEDCLDALAHGINVAVVFATRKGQPLPATHFGVPVIDGDETDLRFLDPRRNGGYVVGLRAKGKARKDTSGFVVRV